MSSSINYTFCQIYSLYIAITHPHYHPHLHPHPPPFTCEDGPRRLSPPPHHHQKTKCYTKTMQTHALSQHQAQIDQVARENGITYLGLFGSYARGEQTSNSDIDMLVDFDHRLSLLDLVRTERIIGEAIGGKIDLIPSNSLNKHVKPYVMQDLITVYGQK